MLCTLQLRFITNPLQRKFTKCDDTNGISILDADFSLWAPPICYIVCPNVSCTVSDKKTPNKTTTWHITDHAAMNQNWNKLCIFMLSFLMEMKHYVIASPPPFVRIAEQGLTSKPTNGSNARIVLQELYFVRLIYSLFAFPIAIM